MMADGDRLLRALAALANPHRMRLVAVLCTGRRFVSQLAREVELSRPLVHMHLQRLEAAGLIRGELELSDDGKAKKYYEVEDFVLRITPDALAAAAASLSDANDLGTTKPAKEK
jgi:predicted transcriptional regulator